MNRLDSDALQTIVGTIVNILEFECQRNRKP